MVCILSRNVLFTVFRLNIHSCQLPKLFWDEAEITVYLLGFYYLPFVGTEKLRCIENKAARTKPTSTGNSQAFPTWEKALEEAKASDEEQNTEKM